MGIIAIIVSDLAQFAIPWITKVLVDGLESHTLFKAELIQWGFVILLLAAVSYGSKQVWRHLILGAARKIEAKLRRQLLDKTLSLSMAEAQQTDNGKFMALASNDVPAVGQALAFGVVACFDSLFITVVTFYLMYRLSPELTAYAVIPFPLLAIIMLLSLKIIYKRWDRVQQSLETLTEKTRESLTGIRTLRSYVQASGDIRQFDHHNDRYRKESLKYVKVDAVFSPLILLFAGSSSAVLLYFGGRLVLAGTLTVGTIAAFVGYLGLLTWPMIAAGWMFVLLQRGSASIGRIDKVLKADSEPESGPAILAVGTLLVRDLTFHYEDDTIGLKDWNLELPPGKSLGIVGAVGSGKSTFLKVLQALESIPPKSLFLEEQDLSEFAPSSVRSLFSYVAQEPFLFSDTISNNLLLADPDARPEEIDEVVRMASLDRELEQFPSGLETLLGERGISLSGGQRQRTALARALLKKAPILLLDDTLSAVDTITESRILDHLRERRKARHQSTVIVTHRLSSVQDADEILVISHGRIVDRGTHDELSKRPGAYQDILALQRSEKRNGLE